MAEAAGPGAGDLAIVLHSHMPYVEGFGTYPFGEEWLFDAVIRSYLPVLDAARDLTLTVTPVLADQLEDGGVQAAPARLPRRVADRRRRSRRRRGPARVPRRLRGRAGALPAGAGAARRGRRGPAAPVSRCRRRGQGRPRRLRRDPRGASPARDPPGPAAPDRRRDPLAPAPLRLGRRLLAARVRLRARPRVATWPSSGVSWFCVDQSSHGGPLDALTPIATEAGPVALPIDWEAVSWLWSLDGYPSDPAHAQFAGKSLRGIRIWKVGGGAYDPEAATVAAAPPGARVPGVRRRPTARIHRRRGSARPARLRDRHRAARATGGRRGRSGWRQVLAGAAEAGVRLVTVPQALAEHEPRRAAARRLELGRGQGPAHLGRARPSATSPGRGGGSSCACCGRCRVGFPRPRRPARHASCSPSSRATGPSSTAAARPATTPSSARPGTPKRRSRP